MAAANRLLGIPEELSVSAPLRTVDVTVTARMDTDLALQSHWLGTRAIGILGAICSRSGSPAWHSPCRRRPSARAPAHAPTGFGADWQVDLDRRGCITAVHGYVRIACARRSAGRLPPHSAGASHHAVAVAALDARSRQDNIQVTIAGEDGQDRVHRLSIEPLPNGAYHLPGPRRHQRGPPGRTSWKTAIGRQPRRRSEEAATSRSDRDRVLAALGHDVRTPMNSIMGICSLLLDSELEQEQRIWLERIRASCEALLAMLNGLLEIASGEVGSAGLQVDEVDVIALVQEVADTLQPQARDKGLELKTRYDDLLRGHWLADPTRLRQVLFNLVGNAIKFTASGHVEIRASAVADAAGRQRSSSPCRTPARHRAGGPRAASSSASSAAATRRTPATRGSVLGWPCAGRMPR